MRKNVIALCSAVILVIILASCAGTAGDAGDAGSAGAQGAAGPAGPQGEAGADAELTDLTCTECHDSTTLIKSKQVQFYDHSVHGTGEAYVRGGSERCAGCHGSEGPEARIDAGLPPHDPSVEGITNVSPYNCRTCHDIHTTYTADDFSLTGDAQPVTFEYVDATFDGGEGNLCSNCHQVRNEKPVVVDGNIEVTSSRFGPHYGAEAPMMLGVGGLGVEGTPSAHYKMVEDTCVGCHMGEERNHTYEPEVDRCQACHTDAEDFDMNGVQTEIQEMLDELAILFEDQGYIDPANGRWVTDTYSEDVANAMWNYKFVIYDQSMGVHNSGYAKALLQQALDVLTAE